MLHHLSILSIAASLCTASIVFGESLSLDTVMEKADQESSGVNRLSPQEQRALEHWIGTWTAKVIQQAPTYHPSMSLSQWVHNWPGYANPQEAPPEEAAQERQESNQKIFRNSNGAVIELYDGSVWNITPVDQPRAQFWARDQRIIISTNPRDIVRPFILVNQQRNETVGGKRAKGPSPGGQRRPDNPAYFKGSVTIASITPDGITIKLSSGDTWIVAPTGQQIVQATWKPMDRVRVEPSADAAFPYSIVNLDSGNSALVQVPRQGIIRGYYQQSAELGAESPSGM
jgi:hypothetical protein